MIGLGTALSLHDGERGGMPLGTPEASTELNRVRSEMRRFHFAFGFGDVLDPGETRFRI